MIDSFRRAAGFGQARQACRSRAKTKLGKDAGGSAGASKQSNICSSAQLAKRDIVHSHSTAMGATEDAARPASPSEQASQSDSSAQRASGEALVLFAAARAGSGSTDRTPPILPEINVALVGHVDSVKGGGIRNTFEVTAERPAACDRGGAWSSSSARRSSQAVEFWFFCAASEAAAFARTQGAALGGAKRKPEDAETRSCQAPHPGGRGRALRRPIPDAPVSSADFVFGAGPKSLSENSTDLCHGSHRATVKLKGHNGKVDDYRAPLKASCGAKKHKKHKRRHRRH